jgi:hypothetical protein
MPTLPHSGRARRARLPHPVLALGLAAALLGGCVPVAPRAVAPRPLAWACPRLTPTAFTTRGMTLLRENGWTLREADSTRGVVRATRGPVYAGLGENLTVDGPYLLSTQHDGQQARVSVQVVETHNHRVIPVENLDDRSADADRRNFLPVVDGLRTACGAPTSGRSPAPSPLPTLPPPGGAGRR